MSDWGMLFFMLILIVFCILLETYKILPIPWIFGIFFLGLFFIVTGDNSSDHYY